MQDEKQVLTQKDQPFLTRDGILALSLYLAGYDCYVVNSYTLEKLRSFGYNGLKPEEAATKAAKEGKKGDVRFLFENWPGNAAFQSYRDESGLFDDNEQRQGRESFRELLQQYRDDEIGIEEFSVRLGCLLFKMRIMFMNAWKTQVPMLRLTNTGQVKHEKFRDGSGVISHPGFIEIPVNASKELKEHLRV